MNREIDLAREDVGGGFLFFSGKTFNCLGWTRAFLKKMRRFGYQSLASVIASYWIYFNKSMYYWVTMQRNLFFGWSSDERYEFVFIE